MDIRKTLTDKLPNHIFKGHQKIFGKGFSKNVTMHTWLLTKIFKTAKLLVTFVKIGHVQY